MTAAETFYKAVREDKLPSAISVIHPDGTVGLLTGVVEVSPEAMPMAYHENRLHRAAASIHFCQAVMKVADQETILRPTHR